jgi:hydroxymethylpyrimidine pyrophosphatase-like HAD family hydrolase
LGKPFELELGSISRTLRFAFSDAMPLSLQNMVNSLYPLPILVVGSGGSLTAAHFIAQVHEKMTGNMARAVSPLEMQFSLINPLQHGVLFFTASGNNKDILNAFDIATRREFATVCIVCARLGSKISEMARSFPAYVHFFEYDNPAGKDGFLAVNSLLSTCILVARGYKALDIAPEEVEEFLANDQRNADSRAIETVLARTTKVVLGADWSWPAVIDFESKFTEAALGPVIVSDLRNFGHGRHHWFGKRGEESALVVLDTPTLASLTDRTLSLLPRQYPRAVLRSRFSGPMATIDLLRWVFIIVNMAGKSQSIDPGKPKVPQFGRKIFHIAPPLSSAVRHTKNRTMWLERKARVRNEPRSSLEYSLRNFLARLEKGMFSGIVFDYDGTLCDPPERFTQPNEPIAAALNDLLDRGIAIGVATGRGGSVQSGLRQVIARHHWERFLVGNYNGSVILPLHCEIPNCDGICSDRVEEAYRLIEFDPLIKNLTEIKKRFKQVSIVPKLDLNRNLVRTRIAELLHAFGEIKIFESDHSIDVVDTDVSKSHLIDNLASTLCGSGGDVLAIGDQGQYGGNDFDLLSGPYSLSVNRVSTSTDSCWNLSPVGLRGAKATISIVKSLKAIDRLLKLDIRALQRGRKE